MVDHGGEIPAAAEEAETDGNTSVSCWGLDERKEEDGEASEVSEEGESEREDEYNFQFEGEMDPLSFVEKEDTSGLPLYEVFQRIEDQYKALSAKKRPAPHHDHRYSAPFWNTHFR